MKYRAIKHSVVKCGALLAVGGLLCGALYAANSKPATTSPAASVTATPTSIVLSGRSIRVTGKGVVVQGNRATITAAGIYRVSGKLDDGQLIVDTPDTHPVRLLLDNASLNNTTGAPLEIRRAERVVVELAQGSVNQLSDTARSGNPEVTAALYSKEDLTVSGQGALKVLGNFKHGILSKDSLKITGGTLTVQAVGDGLKAQDTLHIQSGALTLMTEGDGLQADGAEAGEGIIKIDGGTFNITTGGGSATGARSSQRRWGPQQRMDQETTQQASKGIKAEQQLLINGGTLTVDARENALSSNGTATIAGGVMRLKAGNAGAHADKQLSITGGDVQITQSFEGLESAAMNISGGRVRLQASDDGINLVSRQDGFFGGSRGGGGNIIFTMSGGYVYVDAGGDGADADAAGELTGGTLLINGPAASMNGALDFDGGLTVSGGLLVAVGTAGMAQAPPAASTQNSVSIMLTANQPGGTPVQIATEAGKPLLSFVPTKAYQSVVVSSPGFKSGQTYVAYTGGKFSGNAVNGLYSSSGLSAGTEAARFTINNTVTYVGSGGRGGFGGFGGMGMGRWQ